MHMPKTEALSSMANLVSPLKNRPFLILNSPGRNHMSLQVTMVCTVVHSLTVMATCSTDGIQLPICTVVGGHAVYVSRMYKSWNSKTRPS